MTRRSATTVPELTWDEVSARRLDRHFLSTPATDQSPADIVSAMAGAHAQILTAAEWSIGLRLAGSTRATVQAALWQDRSLVKTFGPRGTVHLLPARELPMWTAALCAASTSRPVPSSAALLTSAQTDEVVAAIAEALAERELAIDELSEAVVAGTGPWAGEPVMPAFGGMWPRWRQALATAAHRGVLCFGPNRGRAITYTNPRRWLPEVAAVEEQTALANLVGRYLHVYGPASAAQFAHWLSVSRGWAVSLFEALGDRLEPVTLDGDLAYVNAGDTVVSSSSPGGVRLLPYFDAFVVGGQPRSKLFPGPAAARALARDQAGNYPVVLVDGVVAGVWHQRRSGRELDVTVEVLADLAPRRRRELEEQAERLASFLDSTLRLTFGPVRVGPHA